jgi:hypothetical protein
VRAVEALRLCALRATARTTSARTSVWALELRAVVLAQPHPGSASKNSGGVEACVLVPMGVHSIAVPS